MLPLFFAAILVGCDSAEVDKYVDQAKKAAEDAGQSIEKAAKETGQSMKKAAAEAKTQIGKAAKETKTQLSQAAKQAREAISPTGQLKITAGGTHDLAACRATISSLPTATVLTLRSAKSPSEETFPSAFIIASAPAGQAAALAGQTLDAKIYLAVKDEHDVWSTTAPVKLRILAVENGSVRGQLTGGELRHAGSGETSLVSGDFTAVLPSD